MPYPPRTQVRTRASGMGKFGPSAQCRPAAGGLRELRDALCDVITLHK